ncbi:MAG: CBS domain-containing protein [Thermoanaerobaculia bacterium]
MKPIEACSCCTPQETAAHAARAMRDSGCGCAPVVENRESRKLVGVVTERDVCCKVAADDRRSSEVPVHEIMRPSSVCCSADEPVEEAHRKLKEHRVSSLPVVDKAGSCCGTVSSHSVSGS